MLCLVLLLYNLFTVMFEALLLLLLLLVINTMSFLLMTSLDSLGCFFLNINLKCLTFSCTLNLLLRISFESKIKILRTNGGGEYMSNQFKSFCLDHGIQHQSSCPYTPQQNVVAERKHKHIFESGLSMLY